LKTKSLKKSITRIHDSFWKQYEEESNLLFFKKGEATLNFSRVASCLPGDDLLSHDSTIGVLGLTAVFGKGTGVAPAL
jgi:hypothetical protein